VNFEIFVKILLQRWQTLDHELANCKTELTVDAVHDLRVSIRRFIAMLDFFKIISPNIDIGISKKELKGVLRLMGPLRDIHVQQELLQSLTTEQDQRVLESIWQQWRVQEAELETSLNELIDHFNPQHSRALVLKIQHLSVDMDYTDFRSKIMSLLDGYFQRIRSLERKAIQPLNEKKLHKMRIEFKKFRYTCEILANGFLDDADAILKVLKEFQSLLGDIHDLDVLRSLVEHARQDASNLKDLVQLGNIQVTILSERVKLFKQFLMSYGRNVEAIAPEQILLTEDGLTV